MTEGEVAVLGAILGRPIVTNGDFVMQLFPNYFGHYMLLTCYSSIQSTGGILSLLLFCSVMVFSTRTSPIGKKFGTRHRQYPRQVF